MSVLASFDLSGRVAVVTGASRGIGAGMARALDEAGARVALVARGAEALAEVAKDLAHDPIVVPADLTDPDAPARIVGEVHEQAGRLDILVNNSGVCPVRPSVDVPLEEWDDTLALNLRAPFLLAREAAKVMLPAGGGKIVNVASVIAMAADAWAAAYTSSKSGVVGLTRSLALEWARKNIQVNALCPGWIETDLTSAMRDDGRLEQRVLAAVPQRRWGQPEDLSGALIFLCSSASDFVTGQTLVADGGLLAGW
ncbi:MAG TPA: glucose 1-dehydrogenase [Acidimicrobiales bacterium]